MTTSNISLRLSSYHLIASQRGALEVAAPASAAPAAVAAADPSIVLLPLFRRRRRRRPPAASSLLLLLPERPPLRRAVDAAAASAVRRRRRGALASVVLRVAVEAQDLCCSRCACDFEARLRYEKITVVIGHVQNQL